ncbi:MAG TPA: Uma2 family endonuclease [Pseudonocardiaceae bacterium]|nr:Uma2 family endonuclease [Pseudonocardiaceae bacterium]
MSVVPAHPESPARRPLTAAEFAAFEEDDQHSWELQEGNLVMSRFASPYHMFASARLLIQLEPQLPEGLFVLQETEIDLRLLQPWEPGTVRRADLTVVEEDAFFRVTEEGGIIRPDDVRLVIEIVSPGSKRMDHRIKREECADAGIGHYWIVDLEKPVSLLPLHLAHDLGYAEDGEVTGDCTVDGPFPVSLRLDELAAEPSSARRDR